MGSSVTVSEVIGGGSEVVERTSCGVDCVDVAVDDSDVVDWAVVD